MEARRCAAPMRSRTRARCRASSVMPMVLPAKFRLRSSCLATTATTTHEGGGCEDGETARGGLGDRRDTGKGCRCRSAGRESGTLRLDVVVDDAVVAAVDHAVVIKIA